MERCITERPEHFGPLFGYCDHQVQKLMDQRLRQYDVSPMQCRTLTYLHEAEGEVNQKQLERYLMVKPRRSTMPLTVLGFTIRCRSSCFWLTSPFASWR